MLSFELSAIDIVLVIVAIVILLLYLKKPAQAKTESEPAVKEKEKEVEIKIPSVSEFKKAKTNSQLGSFKCSHHFEYLKNIPNGKSIPDECYICPRMMQCASGAKVRVRRNR